MIPTPTGFVVCIAGTAFAAGYNPRMFSTSSPTSAAENSVACDLVLTTSLIASPTFSHLPSSNLTLNISIFLSSCLFDDRFRPFAAATLWYVGTKTKSPPASNALAMETGGL